MVQPPALRQVELDAGQLLFEWIEGRLARRGSAVLGCQEHQGAPPYGRAIDPRRRLPKDSVILPLLGRGRINPATYDGSPAQGTSARRGTLRPRPSLSPATARCADVLARRRWCCHCGSTGRTHRDRKGRLRPTQGRFKCPQFITWVSDLRPTRLTSCSGTWAAVKTAKSGPPSSASWRRRESVARRVYSLSSTTVAADCALLCAPPTLAHWSNAVSSTS
jgi:hypothetical protein